jgi:hypothetical protein
MVIMYEDLEEDEMLGRYTGADFTISPQGLQPAILEIGQIYADNFVDGSFDVIWKHT